MGCLYYTPLDTAVTISHRGDFMAAARFGNKTVQCLFVREDVVAELKEKGLRRAMYVA